MKNFDWKSLIYSMLLVALRYVAEALESQNKRAISRNLGVQFPDMQPESDLPSEDEILAKAKKEEDEKSL